MPVMEITVIPMGTGSASMSHLVAEIVKVIENKGVKFELTAMGTIVQGDMETLLEIARELHEVPFKHGAPRVVTFIKLDDRRDKELTIEGKVRSVMEKLK